MASVLLATAWLAGSGVQAEESESTFFCIGAQMWLYTPKKDEAPVYYHYPFTKDAPNGEVKAEVTPHTTLNPRAYAAAGYKILFSSEHIPKENQFQDMADPTKVYPIENDVLPKCTKVEEGPFTCGRGDDFKCALDHNKDTPCDKDRIKVAERCFCTVKITPPKDKFKCAGGELPESPVAPAATNTLPPSLPPQAATLPPTAAAPATPLAAPATPKVSPLAAFGNAFHAAFKAGVKAGGSVVNAALKALPKVDLSQRQTGLTSV